MLKFIKNLKNLFWADYIFTCKLIFAFCLKNYKTNIIFYSQREIIEHLKKGKSIIRFGDGEISLMGMCGIHFQDANKDLGRKLKNIVTEYSSTSFYIIAVGKRYMSISNSKLRELKLLRCWLPSKVYFNHVFPKFMHYGDAHMFYVNGFFEQQIVPLIRHKKIIFVTNESDMTEKKEIVSKSFEDITWVLTPKKNSFSTFDATFEKIIDQVENKENTIVIVSTGPMGKVLAHALSSVEIQTIDLGHGISILFKKDNSLEKILI